MFASSAIDGACGTPRRRAVRRPQARRAFGRAGARVRTSISLGACRCSAAATASAQASGVWKFGTPGGGEPRQRVGRFGHQKRNDRLWRADAVDDRLDREVGIEPRRGADHDHDQIELRRGGQHVEGALHHLVLRAREREIDDPRRRDVDAGHVLDARQGLRRRRLQRDAAGGERIDHHGGAAGGGGHHGDVRPPCSTHSGRHAGEQRKALDQSFQCIDASNAALGEEHAGDVVLARQRAGVRDGQFARRGRAPELVGQHRLAAPGGFEREGAQCVGLAQGFEKQHVAVDAGIVEGRRADLADRKIDLVADRDEAGEVDAARLAARQERADHPAGVRSREDAADRQVRLVECGVGGEKRLVPQVDHAEARRSDETRAGILQELPDPRLARCRLPRRSR